MEEIFYVIYDLFDKIALGPYKFLFNRTLNIFSDKQFNCV